MQEKNEDAQKEYYPVKDFVLSSVFNSLSLITEWFGVTAQTGAPSTKPSCPLPCSSFHTTCGDIVTLPLFL